MLRRLQTKSDRQIDDLCAVGESDWIKDRVLPVVMPLGLDEVASWSVQTLEYLERGANEKQSISKAISVVKTEAKSSGSPEESIRVIVQVLSD
jgi:hypothetical protein